MLASCKVTHVSLEILKKPLPHTLVEGLIALKEPDQTHVNWGSGGQYRDNPEGQAGRGLPLESLIFLIFFYIIRESLFRKLQR